MTIDPKKEQLPTRASWLEINTKALMGNIAAIRALIGATTQLMAVVKGNAYGHGAIIVAEIAQQVGADRLAVATVEEGIELRQHGITLPILVLGHTPLSGVVEALCHDLTLTLHNGDMVAAMAKVVMAGTTTAGDAMGNDKHAPRHLKIHVKVNTGMNRLGLAPANVVAVLQMLQTYYPVLQVEGIFTHFATANEGEGEGEGEGDQSFVEQQFTCFEMLLSKLAAAHLRPPIAHAANSAATIRFPATHLDMVRCGIALYGLHPDVQTCRLSSAFQPVLSWKAQVVQLTSLQPGETVSYGRTFQADYPLVVATIPIGYADGFPRGPYHWGSVLIHGKTAPIVGRICMDQAMVDVTALIEQGQQVQQGDEVIIIGQQQQQTLTAETIGQRIGTINYEVVSQILPRVPRILV